MCVCVIPCGQLRTQASADILKSLVNNLLSISKLTMIEEKLTLLICPYEGRNVTTVIFLFWVNMIVC